MGLPERAEPALTRPRSDPFPTPTVALLFLWWSGPGWPRKITLTRVSCQQASDWEALVGARRMGRRESWLLSLLSVSLPLSWLPSLPSTSCFPLVVGGSLCGASSTGQPTDGCHAAEDPHRRSSPVL